MSEQRTDLKGMVNPSCLIHVSLLADSSVLLKGKEMARRHQHQDTISAGTLASYVGSTGVSAISDTHEYRSDQAMSRRSITMSTIVPPYPVSALPRSSRATEWKSSAAA